MNTFQIKTCLFITGRGLVLAGKMINGELQTGSKINFMVNGANYEKNISSVDMFRSDDPDIQLGLIIKPINLEEKEELLSWKPDLAIAKIS